MRMSDDENLQEVLQAIKPFARSAFVYSKILVNKDDKSEKKTERLRAFFPNSSTMQLAKSRLGIDRMMIMRSGEDQQHGGLLQQGVLNRVFTLKDLKAKSDGLKVFKRRLRDILGLPSAKESDQEEEEENADGAWVNFFSNSNGACTTVACSTGFPFINLETKNKVESDLGRLEGIVDNLKSTTISKELEKLDKAILRALEGKEHSENVQVVSFKKYLMCRTDNRLHVPLSSAHKRRKLEVDVHDFFVLRKILLITQAQLANYGTFPFKDLWDDEHTNSRRCSIAAHIHEGPLKLASPNVDEGWGSISRAIKEGTEFAIDLSTVSEDDDEKKIELATKITCLRSIFSDSVNAAQEIFSCIRNSTVASEIGESVWNSIYSDIFDNENCKLSLAGRPSRGEARRKLDNRSSCGLSAMELRFSNSDTVCLELQLPFRHNCGIEEDETLQRVGLDTEKLIFTTLKNFPTLSNSEILQKVKENQSGQSVKLDRIRHLRKRMSLVPTLSESAFESNGGRFVSGEAYGIGALSNGQPEIMSREAKIDALRRSLLQCLTTLDEIQSNSLTLSEGDDGLDCSLQLLSTVQGKLEGQSSNEQVSSKRQKSTHPT